MVAKRFRSSSLMEFNLQQYLDREFINNGFYFNVPSGFVAVNGQRGDVLQRVNGNIYESFADRWIVETDATGCPGFQTFNPSGVFIDGIFHLRDSLPHKPAIDFKNGRIVFEGTAVAAAAVVSAEFSYKQIATDFPGTNFVNLLFSKIKDNVEFTPHAFPSGNQRQFPLVVIDLQSSFNTPGELGGGKNRNQLVTLHVLSTDRNEVNAITDFVTEVQYRKTVKGVDFNIAPQLFQSNGDRASTYVNYTDLQASGALAWNKMYIDQARVREKEQFYNLFRNRIDLTINLFFLPPDGG